MAETQNELQTSIGNEESATTLKPANVKITNVEIKEVGDKKAKKVICTCTHPDSPTDIHISSVKYEVKGQLDVVGLWFNKDSKGMIKKNSALVTLMNHLGCKTLEDLKGKEVVTILDGNNYLTFKAY